MCRCTGYQNIVAAIRARRRDHARRARAGQRVGRARRRRWSPTSWAQSIKRVEDPRFITGGGNYVDDIKLAVDGPHGHPAQPVRPRQHPLDRHLRGQGDARASSAVFVGADIPYNPLPMAWPAGGSAGIQNNVSTPRILATDSVKWTGEGVAAVVADTRGPGLRRARRDRRRLGAAARGRRCREGDRARRAAAPRERPEQRRLRVERRRQGRHGRRHRWRRGRRPPADRQPAPDPEPDGGPRRHRLVQPGHRRVHDLDVEPDAAHPAAAAGGVRHGRPGAQDPLHQPGRRRRLRDQDLLLRRLRPRACSPARRSAAGRSSGSRAGARTTRARSTAATTSPTSRSRATATARSPGLRVKTLANLGGRLSTIGPGIPTTLYARVLSGCYKIPNVYAEVTGVYTNTDVRGRLPRRRPAGGDLRHRAGDGPVRGRDRDGPRRAPAPELHPARPVPVREPVRARHGQSAAPRSTSTPGNYEPAMDKALATAGYAATSTAKKAEAKARGKLLGMGLSTYIEVCGVAPSKWIGAVGEGWGAAMWESSNIKVHLTGKVVVTMGTQPQGQGHETTYAQVISHELGIPMEDIIIQHSDTQGTPFGYGSYGSRTSSVGMHRGDQGRGQDQGQGPPVRGAHARGLARRHRDRRRQLLGQGLARQGQDDPGDRLRARPRVRCARGHGAVPRRDGLLRHAELHVAVRDAHRGRRDRRGDRSRRARPLRRRRRRRQQDQPDDRRRPAPRRHRPGRRPGALGGRDLQRRGPAADGLDARLRDAPRVDVPATSSSTRP